MNVNINFYRLSAIPFFGVLLLLFSSNTVFGQQGDNHRRDTVYTFIKTPIVKLFLKGDQADRDSTQLLVQGIKQGNIRVLSFIIQNVTGGSFSITQGQKAFIYIEDGSLVNLNCRKTTYSTFGGMSYGNYLSADYELSVYDLDFFNGYNIGNIALESSRGTYNFTIDQSQSDEFKKVLGMIK